MSIREFYVHIIITVVVLHSYSHLLEFSKISSFDIQKFYENFKNLEKNFWTLMNKLFMTLLLSFSSQLLLPCQQNYSVLVFI
jgi:hypothetical protein